MPNSLFAALGGNTAQGSDPMSSFVNEFARFRASFKGDAKAEVQRLLQTGQMTQAQLDALQNTARQLQGLLR